MQPLHRPLFHSHSYTQLPQPQSLPSAHPLQQRPPTQPPHPGSQAQKILTPITLRPAHQERFLHSHSSQQHLPQPFQPFAPDDHEDRDPSAVVDTIIAQPTASDFAAVSNWSEYTPNAPPSNESEVSEDTARVPELEGTLSISELEGPRLTDMPELSSAVAWQQLRE